MMIAALEAAGINTQDKKFESVGRDFVFVLD